MILLSADGLQHRNLHHRCLPTFFFVVVCECINNSAKLPSNPAAIIAKSVILSTESAVKPPDSEILSIKSAVIPTESAILPTISAVVPFESVILPTGSAVVPNQYHQLNQL